MGFGYLGIPSRVASVYSDGLVSSARRNGEELEERRNPCTASMHVTRMFVVDM